MSAARYTDYSDPEDVAAWLDELERQDTAAAEGAEDAEGEAESEAEASALPALRPIRGDAKDWRPSYSDEIFEAPWEEPAWLIPDLELGPGRPAGFIGAPGAGKNDTVQALALAVMSGQPAFGLFPVAKRGRVVHITYDMGRAPTSMRYRQLAAGMGIAPEELRDRLVVCAYPRVNLMSDGARKSYAALMLGFDLAILDNLRAAVPGLDENSSAFGERLQVFAAAAELSECVACFLAHAKKSGGDGSQAIRGSNAIEGAAGVLWKIEGALTSPRKVTHIRQHDLSRGQRPDFWLSRGTPPAEHPYDLGAHPAILPLASFAEPISAERQEGARERVLAALREGEGIGVKALLARTRGAQQPKQQALDALRAEGIIVDRARPGSQGAQLYLAGATGEAGGTCDEGEALDYSDSGDDDRY